MMQLLQHVRSFSLSLGVTALLIANVAAPTASAAGAAPTLNSAQPVSVVRPARGSHSAVQGLAADDNGNFTRRPTTGSARSTIRSLAADDNGNFTGRPAADDNGNITPKPAPGNGSTIRSLAADDNGNFTGRPAADDNGNATPKPIHSTGNAA
jgi:hypothetical protein